MSDTEDNFNNEENTNYTSFSNNEEKTVTPVRKFEMEREERLSKKREQSTQKKLEIQQKATEYKEKLLNDRKNDISETQKKNL
jgi:hypothetical protein